MDGLTLLVAARAAGLDVRAEDERLVVRGRRSLEAIARLVLAHKDKVMRLLTSDGGPSLDPIVGGVLDRPVHPDASEPMDAGAAVRLSSCLRWANCDECGHRFFSLGGDDPLCVVCRHRGGRVPGTRDG